MNFYPIFCKYTHLHGTYDLHLHFFEDKANNIKRLNSKKCK